MGLVGTPALLRAAVATGTAVPAFNVITLEYAEAIVAGAEAAGAPVILAVSHNAVRFHGGRLRPVAAACVELARQADIDVGLHLDHVEDVDLLLQAPAAGFSSAMFDAGHRPHPDNITATSRAVALAHANGLWLEAELGHVGGKADAPESAHAPGVRTDPGEARDYVAATGVDALAVAVGSTHAMTSRSAHLDHRLIAALHAAVPVPLVLHGSSGVSDEDLRAAVRAGMRKVNIGTALNVAFTGGVRGVLAGDPAVVDSRRYLAPARAEMARVVAHLAGVVTGAPAGA